MLHTSTVTSVTDYPLGCDPQQSTNSQVQYLFTTRYTGKSDVKETCLNIFLCLGIKLKIKRLSYNKGVISVVNPVNISLSTLYSANYLGAALYSLC